VVAGLAVAAVEVGQVAVVRTRPAVQEAVAAKAVLEKAAADSEGLAAAMQS
jgi:hypothetical protein